MTQDEMSKIMNILFVSYPATFRDWKEGQFATAKNLWFEMFKTIPYEIVMRAVKNEIAQNRTNFAPSIGEIMYRVKELISVYDSDSAWDEICYLVRMVDIEDVPKAIQGLDDISKQIYSTRDIQRMKNTAGALEKEKPHCLSLYSKLKDRKESEAVEKGDLLSISSDTRLATLGVSKSALQIDHKE